MKPNCVEYVTLFMFVENQTPVWVRGCIGGHEHRKPNCVEYVSLFIFVENQTLVWVQGCIGGGSYWAGRAMVCLVFDPCNSLHCLLFFANDTFILLLQTVFSFRMATCSERMASLRRSEVPRSCSLWTLRYQQSKYLRLLWTNIVHVIGRCHAARTCFSIPMASWCVPGSEEQLLCLSTRTSSAKPTRNLYCSSVTRRIICQVHITCVHFRLLFLPHLTNTALFSLVPACHYLWRIYLWLGKGGARQAWSTSLAPSCVQGPPGQGIRVQAPPEAETLLHFKHSM